MTKIQLIELLNTKYENIEQVEKDYFYYSRKYKQLSVFIEYRNCSSFSNPFLLSDSAKEGEDYEIIDLDLMEFKDEEGKTYFQFVKNEELN